MTTDENTVKELVINLTTCELSEAFAKYQVKEYWKNLCGGTSYTYFGERLAMIRREHDQDIIRYIFNQVYIKFMVPDLDFSTFDYLKIRVTKTDGTIFTVRQEDIKMTDSNVCV